MLPVAEDHKKALDGDLGPNTGGMGAFSPSAAVTPDQLQEIEDTILVPTIHALKRARTPFKGVLYAGLMLTPQGPRVLEFNVRFGDPETQPTLMRLKGDLLDLIEAVVDGRLDQLTPEQVTWDPRPAVAVVLASQGYPGSYPKGKWISGLAEVKDKPDVKVFHAGTKELDGRVVTDGGRVLTVCALGDDMEDARKKAYDAAAGIHFQGMMLRKDIGLKRAAGT